MKNILVVILLMCFAIRVPAKTISVDINRHLAQQIVLANTTYIIKDRIDFLGQTLQLPVSTTIKFEGEGTLLNGVVVGNLLAKTHCKVQMGDANLVVSLRLNTFTKIELEKWLYEPFTSSPELAGEE